MNIILLAATPEVFPDEHNIINVFSGWPWAILGASLAIGILTMTIIEGVKPVLRRFLFRRWVMAWLRKGCILLVDPSSGKPIEPAGSATFHQYLAFGIKGMDEKVVDTALTQLVLLATGGNERALFRLPVENLCGQVAIAVQALLEHPDQFKESLGCLIGYSKSDTPVRKDLEQLLSSGTGTIFNELPGEFQDARNRISNYIQRNIDGLQIDMTYKWRWSLWLASLLISLDLAGMITSFAGYQRGSALFLVIAVVAYEGAFFAGLIRRLLKSLEKRIG